MQRTWQNQMCCMRILNAQRVISCMYSLSVEWSGEKTFQELLVAANCSLTASDSLCCHSCAKSCLSLQHSHKSDMHSRKKKTVQTVLLHLRTKRFQRNWEQRHTGRTTENTVSVQIVQYFANFREAGMRWITFINHSFGGFLKWGYPQIIHL